MLSRRALAQAILTFGRFASARARAFEREGIVRRGNGAISGPGLSERRARYFIFTSKYPARPRAESFLTIARGPSRALSAGLRRKIQYLIFGLGGFRDA